MTNATIAASFLDDFTYTYFGDARLTNRLCKVAAALACDPTATLPESCATEADVEGMYRLLNNERVTFDAILAPHHAATAARCGDYPVVRLIHDTTDVMFSGERSDEGWGASTATTRASCSTSLWRRPQANCRCRWAWLR